MNDDSDWPPALWRLLPELANAIPLLLNPLKPTPTCDADGRGFPVLVIPGIASGDESTVQLRRALKRSGFRPYGWKQGFNLGFREGLLEKLEQHIIGIEKKEGRAPILLGWSLGGLFARALAHRVPQHVAMVVTLSSPFSGSPKANRAWRLYELIGTHKVGDIPPGVEFAAKPPVRTIAVWTKRDGIIAPACARGSSEQSDKRIELDVTHFGFGGTTRGVRQVVDLLSANLPD
ncbi:MAG TPA: alpha/beta fold hydrolase [Sphingomonadaceae bacterium]|nr:alpha/beta fold hydrolase [Sphingomonadaceae bacterium]